MAAGGFLNRAFESMLKECSGKKYPDLQKAIQSYLDSTKDVNQHSAFGRSNQALPLTRDASSLDTEGEAAKPETESDLLCTDQYAAEGARHDGKVLKGMCFMNHQIFRRHLMDFYPLLTKLVCCEQMDVRGALGDLFRVQLKALLP